MLRKASLAALLISGLGQSAFGFCLFSCVPSEADGKAVLENYGIQSTNVFGERVGIKVVIKNFKKVNGKEVTMGRHIIHCFTMRWLNFLMESNNNIPMEN
jgi:hypothetical protein